MSESDSTLHGTTVGIYLAPAGSGEVEFTKPRDAVTEAGATVEVLGIESGEGHTVNNDLAVTVRVPSPRPQRVTEWSE